MQKNVKKKCFYAVLSPVKQNPILSMMIGHLAYSNITPTYINFSQPIPINISDIIDYAKLVYFYSLELNIIEEIENDQIISENILTGNKAIPLGDYQVSFTAIKGFANSSCQYYEKIGTFRPILNSDNNFIFNMDFVPNYSYMYFKNTDITSLITFNSQILAFIISFIESNRMDLIEDFIIQHEKAFADISQESFKNMDRFYEILDSYLQKSPKIFKFFDYFLIIYCMFGLFPRNKFFYSSNNNFTVKFSDLIYHIRTFKNDINNFDSSKIIYKKFIEGMVNLFILEEINFREKAQWAEILLVLNEDLVSEIINCFINMSDIINISINYVKLFSLIKLKVFVPVECLMFSSDFSVLFEFCKFLFSQGKEKEKIDKSMFLKEDLEDIDKEKLNDFKIKIGVTLTNLLKKNDQIFGSLEKIDIYFSSLSKMSKIFSNMFFNEEIIIKINEFLKKKNYNSKFTEKELENLKSILIINNNPFILRDIDTVTYLTSVLKNKYNSNSFYLSQYFGLFLLEDMISSKDFKELLETWLTKFSSKDDLIEVLDKCWNSFGKYENAKLITDKREFFIDNIFKDFSDYYLKNKLFNVLSKINSKDLLDSYMKQYIKKVINPDEFNNLLFDKYNNPLNFLLSFDQKVQNYYIIQNLIDFCYSLIEIPKKEQVLNELFDNPSEDSLIYKILTEKYNLMNNEKLNEVFRSVIDDICKGNLEARLVYTIEGLSEPKKKIMTRMLDKIVEKYFIKTKELKTINLIELFKSNKEVYGKKIKNIELIRDNLSVYCNYGIDYFENYNEINTLRNSVADKRISEIIIPKKMECYLVYAQILNDYIYLESFEKFRMEAFKNIKENNCLFYLEISVKLLENYQTTLVYLVTNKETTVLDFKNFFHDISNMKMEADLILKNNLLQKDQTDFICQSLEFYNNKKELRRLCKCVLKVVKLFNVEFDALSLVNEFLHMKTKTTLLKDFHGIVKKINESLPITRNNINYKIMIEMDGSEDLFAFCMERKDQTEIECMKEAANEYDEEHISTQTIFDFINFWNFFNQLRISLSEKGGTLLMFLNVVEQLAQNKMYIDIVSNIKTSKVNFLAIKELYMELTHKEEAKRKQIFKIVVNSTMKITYQKKNFDIQLKLDEKSLKKGNYSLFSSFELIELKHRANLIIYTEQKKGLMQENLNFQEEEVRKFKSFDLLVDSITRTLESLNLLRESGYPNILALMPLNSLIGILDYQFKCLEGEFEDLLEFQKEVESIIEKWQYSIKEAYERFYELTFLKENDFWKVEKHLSQNEGTYKGRNLLKYMQKRRMKLKKDKTIQIPARERLFELGKFISELENTEGKLEKFNINKEIKEEYLFFVAETNDKPIFLKTLLSIFLIVEGKLPEAYQIVICHQKTTWNELTAFAHRCFFSNRKELFCLIHPEKLNFWMQDEFSNLFRDLIENHENKEFSLGFVTTREGDSHLISSLKSKKKKVFKYEEFISDADMKTLIKKRTNNTVLVTASISGLGKSEIIAKMVKQANQIQNKIPIHGDVNPIEIGRILLQCLNGTENDTGKICLTFSLGAISANDISLLNQILFCIVVMKTYHYSKNVVIIPENCLIFIELDSSYYENLKNEIELFEFLENHHIPAINWNEMLFKKKKIQFILHYLKSLNEKTIGFTDIYEEQTKKEIIDFPKCKKFFLDDLFLKNKDRIFVTYTQYKIFVKVLYSLLDSFSQCGFFAYGTLSKNANNNDRDKDTIFISDDIISQMRTSFVIALIASADLFTSKSVQNVRQQQNSSLFKLKDRKGSGGHEIIEEAVVSWENTTPFFVVFTSDHVPAYIYKEKKDIPAEFLNLLENQNQIYRNYGMNDAVVQDFRKFDQITLQKELFEKLCSLSNSIANRNVCIKCFKKYEKKELKCWACKEDLLINRGEPGFIRTIAEYSVKDYVLTLDNYIKMLLIYTRIKARIPVIIKGETGCGKTSLIRFLCTKVLDDEFYLFSIHAGITDEAIANEMNIIIIMAMELEVLEKRIWVFFDEFNTTESIGMIKEIICERTMFGKKLPYNILFLGACNPFRLKTNALLYDENVGIKKTNFEDKYNLLYTVKPLPESLIEYVWDYGHLTPKTENEYIQTMFRTLDFGNNQKTLTFVSELISECHKKFRVWEDVSSVSLRDVARYKKLYTWFLNSIKTRDELKKKNRKKIEGIHQRAAILSLMHCYFLRISSQAHRNEMMNDLVPYFQKMGFNKNDVEVLLEEEESEFLDRMDLPEGIAKNHALKENVFALIVCIVNKIPLFICGKPGCSKSLAIQLVLNNLRGKKSNDPYFKTLPELIPIAYQGSEYCTSESILSVFTRAEKYLAVAKDGNILPVFWFDEIGLAELSKNNPLKVLHNKLEIENIQVAFVGISNWRLDASKMNRAIYLARADPTIEDLKFTAQEIFKSINKNMIPKDFVINGLATSYVRLRDKLKEIRKEDIFGLRDFYHLCKGISFDLLKEEVNEFAIIRKNMKKNFSGMNFEKEDGGKIKNIQNNKNKINTAYDYLWECYCRVIGKPEKIREVEDQPVIELIKSNLKETTSRYLMIITDNDCISEYLEDILKIDDNISFNMNNGNNVKVIVGSYMSEDLKETYGYRILSDVILYIERGYILIFKKVDYIYGSLYDLFNQNFSWSGDKKYCRIALGAIFNPKCLVNKDFHCIIFMNEKDLEKADPPFLNRFEKYHIKLEDIISERQGILLEQLNEWIISICGDNNISVLPPKFIFPNFSREYLIFLIMNQLQKLQNGDDQQILKLCQTELIKNFSFEFVILVSLNIKNLEQKQELLETYYKTKREGFIGLLGSILKNEQGFEKTIIYTYTQITETIKYETENVKELKLGIFKSEREIKDELKRYFSSKQQLLVIRINFASESSHLLSLKHVILNYIDDLQNSKGRHLMIIIHLQRFKLEETVFDVLFQGWNSYMFDLLEQNYMLPIDCIEDESFASLMHHPTMIPFQELCPRLFDECLTKIRYQTQEKNRLNQRRNWLLENLKKNQGEIIDLLSEKFYNVLEQEKNLDLPKLLLPTSYLNDGRIRATAISPSEALNMNLQKFYLEKLFKIVVILENLNILDSFFEANSNNNKFFINIWIENFMKLKVDVQKNFNNQIVVVKFNFDLKFPFSILEYSKIIQIQNSDIEINVQNENFASTAVFENFKEISIFENKNQNFYEQLFDQEYEFNALFNDFLILFVSANNIDINKKTINCVLRNNFLNQNKQLLIFFLRRSKILLNIISVLENIIKFPQGNRFLENCMDCLISDEYKKEIDIKSSAKNLILYSQGNFYRINREQVKIYEEKKDEIIEDLEKIEDEYPYLLILFENMIDQMTSLEFLEIFKNITDLKTEFARIEENIIKTGIIPKNLENLRPWVELIKFLALYDENPNTTFQKLLEFLRNNKHENCFFDIELLKKIMGLLTQAIKFKKTFIKEKENKLIKLQCQLLKNFASIDQNSLKYLEKILFEIDKSPDLWRSSAKIFYLLDNCLLFKKNLVKFEGNLEEFLIILNQENNDCYEDFEKILQETHKIPFLIANKIYVSIIDKWYNKFETVFSEKFKIFVNLKDFLNMKLKENNNEKINMPIYFSLIWIKCYLFCYIRFLVINKNENKNEFIKEIDKNLCEKNSISATLRIFCMKLLLFETQKTRPNELKNEYPNLNWLKINFLIENPNKNNLNLILPYPFKEKESYAKIEIKLNNMYSNPENITNKIIDFIINYRKDFDKLICIFCWFLNFYVNYISDKFVPNLEFINGLRKDKDELTKKLGAEITSLLIKLSGNFEKDSYFYLVPNLTMDELNKKINFLYLSIFFIAQQNLNTTISSFIFENNAITKNIAKLLENNYIYGLVEIDPIIENMKDVKLMITHRLKHNMIARKSIFKCGANCDFYFYFLDCGNPVVAPVETRCPFCNERYGAQTYATLLVRNNGNEQIELPIEKAFQMIDEYIQKKNKNQKKGYIFREIKENFKLESKNHIQAITYRCLHFIIHCLIYSLFELDLFTKNNIDAILPQKNIISIEYFKNHMLQDFQFINELTNANNETYIWIFQMISNISTLFNLKGPLPNGAELYNFELSFEEKIISPLFKSVTETIQNFKQELKLFTTAKNKTDENISFYLNELELNPTLYPFLQYFNLIGLPNPQEVEIRFNAIKENMQQYPLFDLFLNSTNEKSLSQINNLYSMTQFINNLVIKYQFRISRAQATTFTIKDMYKDDPDLQQRFENFQNDWNSLNLVEVDVDCHQHINFKKIDDSTSLALLLPNSSKDESGLMITGVMMKLRQIYNNYIYMAKLSENPSEDINNIINKENQTAVLLQNQTKDSLLTVKKNKIFRDLIKMGFMNNYEYGKGKEIHYDFEDMERTLRDYANGKRVLNPDNDKFIKMSYQFEMYQASSSLIQDIRKKNKQKLIEPDLKLKLKNYLKGINKKEKINYLGSLDYVFTYLRNSKEDKNQILEAFCTKAIKNHGELHELVIRKQPLCSIPIENILDLYDLVEELIFDEAQIDFIKPDMNELIEEQERDSIIQTFDEQIQHITDMNIKKKENLCKFFKKVIFRIQVDINQRLREYFVRPDLWDEEIDLNELNNIELNEKILLKHSYIIWQHFNKLSQKIEIKKEEPKIEKESFFRTQESKIKPGPNKNIPKKKKIIN